MMVFTQNVIQKRKYKTMAYRESFTKSTSAPRNTEICRLFAFNQDYFYTPDNKLIGMSIVFCSSVYRKGFF